MPFNVTYPTVEAQRATKMSTLMINSSSFIVQGRFRDARACQREFAQIATENLDTLKTLPIIKLIGPNGLKESFVWALKNLTFKIFKTFTRKTPEEKQLKNFAQKYFKEITPEELKKRTLAIDLQAPLFC